MGNNEEEKISEEFWERDLKFDSESVHVSNLSLKYIRAEQSSHCPGFENWATLDAVFSMDLSGPFAKTRTTVQHQGDGREL